MSTFGGYEMAYSTPNTAAAGAVATAADYNTYVRDNFNAAFPLAVDGWSSFTPTLVQSGAVTKTVTYAKYMRVGRVIFATINLAITGAGTTANAITVGLPVTAASSSGVVGSFRYFDTGSTIYAGTVLSSSTTAVQCFVSGNGNPMGVNPTFAAASGDSIQLQVTYEAAT